MRGRPLTQAQVNSQNELFFKWRRKTTIRSSGSCVQAGVLMQNLKGPSRSCFCNGDKHFATEDSVELTISSLKLGRAFTFFSAHVTEIETHMSTSTSTGSRGAASAGRSVVEGARLMGSTLRATEASFESTCRNWMRQHAQHPDEVAYGASLSEVRMRRGTRTVSIRLTPLQPKAFAWAARHGRTERLTQEEEPF